MKSMKKNILEEIPGIWPITRKKLLKAAWSIEWIRSLSDEQMSALCTPRQVGILQDHGIY
jgi:excinuclease UvrABC nuclease subunit